MLEELGISFGTAVLILFALYFVVKWAVRNAIDESKDEIAAAVRKALKGPVGTEEDEDL